MSGKKGIAKSKAPEDGKTRETAKLPKVARGNHRDKQTPTDTTMTAKQGAKGHAPTLTDATVATVKKIRGSQTFVGATLTAPKVGGFAQPCVGTTATERKNKRHEQAFTVADMVAKRKAVWEARQDADYDRALVRAAAVKILSEPSLAAEILEKPYLLIEICFSVVNKEKQTVPFFLNEVQRDFLAQYERFGTGKPFFILKGRQQGFTTLITAMQLAFAIVQKNFSGFTLADSADNTRAIFNDKARMVYNRLPDELKPTEKFNSTNELFFDKLNSSWRVSTATDQVGRSRTLSFVHFSEVAFYKCSLANLQKGIGEATTAGAFIVYETTANGFNEAKELWDSGSCRNLFYEWWRTAEYRSTEYEYLNGADAWLTERLRFLSGKGLDREQLAWYARKYAGYLDKATIRQEYPCTPEEAFVASGDCVFDLAALNNRLIAVGGEKPLRVGYFTYVKAERMERSPDRDGGEQVFTSKSLEDIRFVDDPGGYIRIHRMPEVQRDSYGAEVSRTPYTIGGDTAGLGSDWCAAKVIDNLTTHTVATLHKQRMDSDLYAEQLFCLGKMYHDALIGIETNFSRNPIRVLEQLSYPNLAMRERVDRDGSVEKIAGFLTTHATREVILDELIRAFREEPEIECDAATLREMTVFVRKPTGRREAMDGAHDDLVFALAIAHHVGYQQRKTPLPPESTEPNFLQSHFRMSEEDMSGAQDAATGLEWEDFF